MHLNVPFISQLSFGRAGTDPTGCWYAGARMLAAAFEAGPRLGVPALYSLKFEDKYGRQMVGHKAIGVSDFKKKLMKNEHLVEVERTVLGDSKLLRNTVLLRGPLMFAWNKTRGDTTYGHCSVIIGTEEDEVIFHDPEDAPQSRMAIGRLRSACAGMKAFPIVRRDAPARSYFVDVVP